MGVFWEGGIGALTNAPPPRPSSNLFTNFPPPDTPLQQYKDKTKIKKVEVKNSLMRG